jgi:hypothetical protein
MLQPFGVYPRNVRREDGKVVRCYMRWEVEHASSQHQSRRQSLAGIKIEIPNKDADCSKVVEDQAEATQPPNGGAQQPALEAATEAPSAIPEAIVPQSAALSYAELVKSYRGDRNEAVAIEFDTRYA